MYDVLIFDAGYWGGRLSNARRMLPCLREAEMAGQLKITQLHYVWGDADLNQQLKNEPSLVHTKWKEATSEIRRERVRYTAKSFKYGFNDDTDIENIKLPQENDHFIIVIVMPPSPQRNRLITQLVQQTTKTPILIVPPAFSNTDELTQVKETDQKQNLIPFLPYRFSKGMQALIKRQKKIDLESALVEVTSGPYPARGAGFRPWLYEYCLPFLDCLVHVAGNVEEGNLLFKETQQTGIRLPILLGNWIHETGVVSSCVFTATGNFQQINFLMTAFFKGERLSLTSAFREIEHRQTNRHKFTESGHDLSVAERNGYLKFIRKSINRDPKLPTLTSFLETQRLLDAIYQALIQLPPSPLPQQKRITFRIEK